MEIRAHTILEVNGFANVNNYPIGVFHDVTAGFGWQGIQNALQVRRDLHCLDFNLILDVWRVYTWVLSMTKPLYPYCTCKEEYLMEGRDYTELDPEERTNKFMALFSIALGVISLCAALIPLCGGASSLLGIGLGIFGLRSENRSMAQIGIGVCALGLLISIVYMVLLFLQR
jgi:hypothetical protein